MKCLLVALLFVPGPAYAHAHLEEAVPAAGGTVTAAPAELQLDFSEGVEPRFTKVAVTGPSGAPVAVGALHVDPDNNKHLFVPVPTLAPGSYTVSWRAVAVDTHKTHGTYSFTVAP
jgi:methionine-rich copper-binding protein CopC